MMTHVASAVTTGPGQANLLEKMTPTILNFVWIAIASFFVSYMQVCCSAAANRAMEAFGNLDIVAVSEPCFLVWDMRAALLSHESERQVAFFNLAASRQAARMRKLYFKTIMGQDMAWYAKLGAPSRPCDDFVGADHGFGRCCVLKVFSLSLCVGQGAWISAVVHGIDKPCAWNLWQQMCQVVKLTSTVRQVRLHQLGRTDNQSCWVCWSSFPS
jgi:hypothetical protein